MRNIPLQFVKIILNNVVDSDAVLHEQFNAGTNITIQKINYGTFEMWINKSGIENLLSVPPLEEYGYRFKYNILG